MPDNTNETNSAEPSTLHPNGPCYHNASEPLPSEEATTTAPPVEPEGILARETYKFFPLSEQATIKLKVVYNYAYNFVLEAASRDFRAFIETDVPSNFGKALDISNRDFELSSLEDFSFYSSDKIETIRSAMGSGPHLSASLHTLKSNELISEDDYSRALSGDDDAAVRISSDDLYRYLPLDRREDSYVRDNRALNSGVRRTLVNRVFAIPGEFGDGDEPHGPEYDAHVASQVEKLQTVYDDFLSELPMDILKRQAPRLNSIVDRAFRAAQASCGIHAVRLRDAISSSNATELNDNLEQERRSFREALETARPDQTNVEPQDDTRTEPDCCFENGYHCGELHIPAQAQDLCEPPLERAWTHHDTLQLEIRLCGTDSALLMSDEDMNL